MPRALSCAVGAAVLLAVGVSGCSSSGSDVAGNVCQKADGCTALSGINAGQCKDLINKSLNAMSSGARADAEKSYTACLAMMDCGAFNACISSVMQGGSSSGSGGSATGGGSGGTSVPGS